MCLVAIAAIAAVTAYMCLKSSAKETDALFVTKNGDRVQEHIKLTDDEAVIYKDGFAMVYDFSKGLIVHRWLQENAVMNSCFVESFNTTQFSSIDQMKSMMENIKHGQANFVERDETETYIATDIRLPTSALGPASRDLCNNKDVFFIRRVPDNKNTDSVTSSRVKRNKDKLVVKEKTCVLLIFCKTKKLVVTVERNK